MWQTMAAYSGGLPRRLGNWVISISGIFTLSGAAFISGVLKMPGAMVLQRMPSGARSRAMGRVIPTTPPLVAA